jgi:uncharacterized protein (TIGR02594 family)
MSSPADSAVEPLWLKNARELVGLKEIVGSRHEAKVLEFFKEAGHPEIHDDETAWCAAFANAMVRRAGYAGTGSLAARSFLTWGTPLQVPQLGCIVVYKRGNSNWLGHVNFFTRKVGNRIYGIGGNQGNSVSETTMLESDVLGYRWPLIKSGGVIIERPPVVITKPVVKKTPVVIGTAAGGAVVAGATKAAQQGVSAMEIIVWVIAAIAVGVGGYFAYRWWKNRKIEETSSPVVEVHEDAAAVADIAAATLVPLPVVPTPDRKRRAKKAAPKKAAKRKPAKKEAR